MTRNDLAWMVAVAVTFLAMLGFATLVYNKVPLALACAQGTGPATLCALRDAIAWAIRATVFGTGALLLGIAAFLHPRVPVCAAAIMFGLGGMLFYNVSWGTLGAALGAWAWYTRGLTGQPGNTSPS